MTKIKSQAPVNLNLVTLEGAAKQKHLFNKLVSEATIIEKCLSLVAAVRVTKYIAIMNLSLVTRKRN